MEDYFIFKKEKVHCGVGPRQEMSQVAERHLRARGMLRGQHAQGPVEVSPGWTSSR